MNGLKNQDAMLQNSMQDNEKKLSQNSEFNAVNSLYEKLRQSLDEVAAQVTRKTQTSELKRKLAEIHNDQNQKMVKAHNIETQIKKDAESQCEELKLQKQQKILTLENYSTQLDKEIEKVISECNSLENELMYQNSRTENVKELTEEVDLTIDQLKHRIKNQQILKSFLDKKWEDERPELEKIEVAFYNQTVQQAQFSERVEHILVFFEEFTKRLRLQQIEGEEVSLMTRLTFAWSQA